MNTLLLSSLLALSTTLPQPSLTVQVEPMTMQSSIPRGAQRVPMITLQISASCVSAVPISAVTLFHEGAGSAGDLTRVYAIEGLKRMSRGVVPTERDGKVTVRFPSLSIPACSKRTLTFVSDIAAESATGGEHRFVLRAASDIETGALDALVQIGTGRGRMPTPVVRTVGPAQGTLSVGYVSIPLPLTYGSNRILSRFSLTADRSNDHLVTAITLTNEGKAHNADLQNLFITSSDGKRLTDIVTSLDGDTLRFDFDPALRIGKNSGRMFVLRGDIRASRRQTIEFRIQEPSDIEATVARGRTTTAP